MREFVLLFVGILMLASCSNESAFQEEIVTASVVAGKIGVCHNGGNEIVISENALQTHIDHGDAVDRDGDGFYDAENPCSEIDCDDTTYSLDNSCGTPATIGDLRDGGVVFWVNPDDNTHGFVVSLREQGFAQWGCWLTDIPKANFVEFQIMGEGYNLTQAILQNCSEPGIAAEIAVNYRGGNYSDWFLPSFFELRRLLEVDYLINPTLTLKANGGQRVDFGLSDYWSSNQRDIYSAYHSVPVTFINYYSEKSETFQVRPIRAF